MNEEQLLTIEPNLTLEDMKNIFQGITNFAITPTLEQIEKLPSLNNPKPIIAIVGAPKSGSTYLTNVILNISGLKYFHLSSCTMQEHNLNLTHLYLAQNVGCISQNHMTGNIYNAKLMQKFNIKPLILFRNIFDTVISFAKDLKRIQANNLYLSGYGYAFLWNSKYSIDKKPAELYNLVIDLAIPWFIKTYASWYQLQQNKLINGYWLTYEELMADKHATIHKILSFLEINIDSTNISSILSRYYQSSDYDHHGKEINPIGIGKDTLTKHQQEKIIRYTKYYPNVDFSNIGVKPC